MAVSALSSSGLTRRRMLFLLTGLLLAQMTATIEGTVVATAYPTIAADLGGLRRVSWIFIAFSLTSTTTTMLWGKLSDLFGRRRFYEASIAIFMSGSMLCGASRSITMMRRLSQPHSCPICSTSKSAMTHADSSPAPV